MNISTTPTFVEEKSIKGEFKIYPNPSQGLFMLELKVTKTHKVSFSPHQKLFHMTKTKRNFILLEDTSSRSIKLYESKSIHGLLIDHRETPSLTHNDWDHVQRLLLDASLDA